MAQVLPPGLSEAQFKRALDLFAGEIGAEHVRADPGTLKEFRDPFAFASWDAYDPSAVLQPASVDEIRAILRIANEFKIPLWTSSQGRNNGYGGAAPRVKGSVLVNLRRMDRVLEINEECAYALIEPGVSFFDLHDAIQKSGAKLWMSVPDIGWGSVIGNTLDHGLGYTLTGDHPANQCGMEVVLANGDVLRTGMGAMPNSRAWQVYKRGLGPSADGLFMQSNFGIVTKMGVWLMPRPECYAPAWLTVRREADLEALVEAYRPLLLDKVIANTPMIFNAVCAASAMSPRRRWYSGDGAIPEEVLDRIAAQPGFGRWVSRFALYGREKLVERQAEIARAAFAKIPGAELTIKTYDGANPPEFEDANERVQAGVPSMALNEMTKWYGGEEGGHIGFSPAAPLTAKDASAVRELVRNGLARFGLDYAAAVILQPRCFIHVCLVVFDTKDEAQTKRAYDASKALVREAAKLGYGEYRAHLDFMDLALEQYDFNDHALRRFNETLKDALDPNGILSPGKQGIWPKAMRGARDGRAPGS